jgi:FKBP12-rapamycin complex-associated protein
MSLIVQIIGSHIRIYLQEVFELTTELWSNRSLHLPIVGLIESLATAMAAEFKPYLPTVIPQLLTVFEEPPNPERSQTEIKVFHAMLAFGSSVEQYIHLLLPAVLTTIEREGASRECKRAAVRTIAGLARRVNLSASASRIIQPLVRTMPFADTQLRESIMTTLCVLAQQLGPDFAVFVPRVSSVSFLPNRITNTRHSA